VIVDVTAQQQNIMQARRKR